MSNDRYRQVIFNAQVYANMGAGTYEKAVDMATKDFLRAGINCVEYKNGSRHTVEDYTDMSIRTAGKRAYLTGEGEKRKEWGISTVIMNKRGNPCAKCLPFVGKVLIDDVWSGGKQEDGPYQLMSEAIAAGLYHPRCKDSHTTYFPELDNGDDTPTKEEKKEVIDNYNQEQKANYCKTEANKLDRMAKYSLDPDNKKMYQARADAWKEQLAKSSNSSNENIEYGITGKKVHNNCNNVVNLKYINGKEYRKKFDNIDLEEKTNEEIYQRVKAMLIHRNGTNKEDMYLISCVDNKVKGKSVNSKIDDVVEYNKSLINAIYSEQKGTLISIHNHGTNNPPTGADFASAGSRGYKKGIVACHNGDVYLYEVGNKPFSSKIFDETVAKYKKKGYTDGIEAHIETLKQFEKDYDIKWRKL